MRWLGQGKALHPPTHTTEVSGWMDSHYVPLHFQCREISVRCSAGRAAAVSAHTVTSCTPAHFPNPSNTPVFSPALKQGSGSLK